MCYFKYMKAVIFSFFGGAKDFGQVAFLASENDFISSTFFSNLILNFDLSNSHLSKVESKHKNHLFQCVIAQKNWIDSLITNMKSKFKYRYQFFLESKLFFILQTLYQEPLNGEYCSFLLKDVCKSIDSNEYILAEYEIFVKSPCESSVAAFIWSTGMVDISEFYLCKYMFFIRPHKSRIQKKG